MSLLTGNSESFSKRFLGSETFPNGNLPTLWTI